MPNRRFGFFPSFSAKASSHHTTFCFRGLGEIQRKKYYLISRFNSWVPFCLENSSHNLELVQANPGSQVGWGKKKKGHSKRSHTLGDILPWLLQHIPRSKRSFALRMPWEWKPLYKVITNQLYLGLWKHLKRHRGIPTRNCTALRCKPDSGLDEPL